MGHINLSVIQARYTQVMVGIQKHITSPVVLIGVTYAQTALLQLFQSWGTAAVAVATAKAQYHAAVVAEEMLFKTCQAVWLALQSYARITYATDTAALADFGYVPVKHTAPTPAVKAAAAVKAKATRAARHTMGKNQKKLVTAAAPAAAPATSNGASPVVVTK